MSDHSPRATGAMPPPQFAWQIGKTAASIRFVNEAEAYLASLPQAKFAFDTENDMTTRHDALRAQIADLKSGKEVLKSFTSVEVFLFTQPRQ